MNLLTIKKRLTSTKHWYIRLIQWPFIIAFYVPLCATMIMLLIVIAVFWPFYDFEK